MAAEIFQIIKRINTEQKSSILLVEQNANMALEVADYGYIMENGKIVLDGPSLKLAENEDVKEFYLGLSEIGAKKSYREVKHYRRRKRWLS
jgi:branched-chain amino acid transport system ATP-binding protein